MCGGVLIKGYDQVLKYLIMTKVYRVRNLKLDAEGTPRVFVGVCCSDPVLLCTVDQSIAMGITGLLPLLKPVIKDTHIRELKGLVSDFG